MTTLIFLISNLLMFPVTANRYYPQGIQLLVAKTGLSAALITLIFGQIYPQLLADEYTYRMLNRCGSMISVRVSYGLENIGVFTSFTYVMYYTFYSIMIFYSAPSVNEVNSFEATGVAHDDSVPLFRQEESREDGDRIKQPPSSSNEIMLTGDDVLLHQVSFADILKICSSTVIVVASTILVGCDIFYNSSSFGHPLASVFLLLVCMIIIFYLEGLQLAILSMPSTTGRNVQCEGENLERAHSIQKYMIKEVVMVKRFLIGRQILVVMVTFLASMICCSDNALALAEHIGLFDSDTSSPAQAFIFTILCNPNIAEILLILNVVIIPAQLFARKNPVQFLNLRGCMLLLKMSLLLESVGTAHFGWYLFYLTKNGMLSQRFHTTNEDNDNEDTITGSNDNDENEDTIEL